jgi:hypothetical protein
MIRVHAQIISGQNKEMENENQIDAFVAFSGFAFDGFHGNGR